MKLYPLALFLCTTALAAEIRLGIIGIDFDPKTETSGDDKAANTYLTKIYRSPNDLPRL